MRITRSEGSSLPMYPRLVTVDKYPDVVVLQVNNVRGIVLDTRTTDEYVVVGSIIYSLEAMEITPFHGSITLSNE